jgi:hypothetical protein
MQGLLQQMCRRVIALCRRSAATWALTIFPTHWADRSLPVHDGQLPYQLSPPLDGEDKVVASRDFLSYLPA